MSDYSRPASGFRFKYGGIKTNCRADACSPEKYPYALNVRGVNDEEVQPRPGLSGLFATQGSAGHVAITDLRTYTALNTDNKPRILARDINGRIWLDNGVAAGTGIIGAAPDGKLGASMIPFRPAQSPNPFMYIANGLGYQKFSSPSSSNVVTQQNVGIAEPQAAIEAQLQTARHFFVGPPGPSTPAYTSGGTAGANTNGARLSDTVQGVVQDPVTGLTSVQVTSAAQYAKMMPLSIAGPSPFGIGYYIVQDVFPPILGTSVSAISYLSGSSGRCVVVPFGSPGGPGVEESSIYGASALANLRRGSLVQIGSETCLVLSVTNGPQGTVSFETSTISTHVFGEVITGLPAIQVQGEIVVHAGGTIASADLQFAVSAGVGHVSAAMTPGSLNGFQNDDYLHFSVNIDNLDNFVEGKIILDVNNGAADYVSNAYFYSFRANDIQAGISNALTQLGVAQLVAQRALIDAEASTEIANQGTTTSSAQTSTGSGQWSEIAIPFSRLTRIGSDESRTIANVQGVRILFNAGGTINVKLNGPNIFGGSQPDVGDSGAPYQYRIVPRSTATGVKGNPSPLMRYGVSPRRQLVNLSLPASYDPQFNVFDIFRYGGSVTSFRYIGTGPVSTIFQDNYDDQAALAGNALELDNLEPWPTIDVPYAGTAVTVAGTIAIVTFPSNQGINAVGRLLPGNFVQIGGQNVYTLWNRPVQVASIGGLQTFLFQFVENAGALTNQPLSIYEPLIAAQPLPYMWGPDASGTVFAVGDPLRPGTFSFTKNNNPDSAPDRYNIEVTSPTEPLMGGEVLDGLSYMSSTERWWALYPQPQNPLQRYSIIQQPIPRGLAAPYGHCTDGRSIYFWAKDGIWSTSQGSLTDADLYNIFPHEGVAGVAYTYAGFTVQPPDYSRAGTFRLAYSAGYLYAVYQDSTGTYRSLTLCLRTMAWTVDDYNGTDVSCVYHPEQQEGTLFSQTLSPPLAALYPTLLLGTTNGIVAEQMDGAGDFGLPIDCAISTMEWPGGDLRGGEFWGDIMLDCLPSNDLVCTPLFLGSPPVSPTTITSSPVRAQRIVSLQGDVLTNFLGLLVQWQEVALSIPSLAIPTKLFIWQPSFLPKPEETSDRFTDWDVAGTRANKFFQGFILHADTFNQVKGLQVRDADTQQLHAFTPQVQHNGEQSLPYSFVVPFSAHMVRIEPTDQLLWRFFDAEWVHEQTPESAQTWAAQGTAFGMTGYMHIKQVSAAYQSTSAVNLVITSFDGQSPLPISLPSTGGAYKKVTLILTPNKGQLFFLSASSSSGFQFFLDSWEILVGQWARQEAYLRYRSLGGQTGDSAKI